MRGLRRTDSSYGEKRLGLADNSISPPTPFIGVSSFDVLDALVAYYMDRDLYSNLKVTTGREIL